MTFIPAEIIKKKKLGLENSPAEINWLIQAFVRGEFADYQMAAWAMAVWIRGMSNGETAALTHSMLNSGSKFDFSFLNSPRIDKHSTGGVGDKTSLIIGPILAAAQVHVPMIAGRGLGHTGGTLDKLESLPGFRVQLGKNEFTELVQKYYFSLMGQTEDICPADRKLYALRDVTATVDSLPLICASIMSKKLAEDLTGLVLDIKFGSGAFMKTEAQALDLAQLLKSTGEQNGVQVIALLTNMNQPLGRYIGNALEVKECFEIMNGQTKIENNYDFYGPTRDLSVTLAGYMLYLAKKSLTPESGITQAQILLESGEALECFKKLLKYQGPCSIEDLSISKNIHTLMAPKSGYINSIQTEAVGLASIELHAGRKRTNDQIDYSTGIEMCCYLGAQVEIGTPLMKLYYSSEIDLKNALEQLHNSIEISSHPVKEQLPLISKVVI